MRRDAGLTLLELLLVVFILSVLSLGAVSLIDTSDNQWRFEDTASRLKRIRAAVVGEQGPVHGGVWRLSGFVADVGVPPESLASLTGPTVEGDVLYGKKTPKWGTPGSLVEFDSFGLFKGRRPPYVVVDATASADPTTFEDGWGNPWDYSVVRDTNNLPLEIAVQSYGADGQAGEQWGGEYDADFAPLFVKRGDWSFQGNLIVEVHNRTAADLTNLRVDLLVYDDGTWRRVPSRSGATIDGKSVAAGSSAQFTIAETDPIATIADTIPIGAHLIVLVQDANKQVDDADTPYGNSPYVARIVELYPGLSSLQTELVVTQ